MLKGLKLGGADNNPATPPNEVEPIDLPEDSDSTEGADPVEVTQEPTSAEPAARWTCYPIGRFTLGDYQFKDGLLVLQTQEESDAFDAVYAALPISEQTRMRKLDLSAAEAIAKARIASSGGATKGIDSSTGERAINSQVGVGDLLAGS